MSSGNVVGDEFGAFSPALSPSRPPSSPTDNTTASRLARLASLVSGGVPPAGKGRCGDGPNPDDWFVAETREILNDDWGRSADIGQTAALSGEPTGLVASTDALWAVLTDADRRARAAEVCSVYYRSRTLSHLLALYLRLRIRSKFDIPFTR